MGPRRIFLLILAGALLAAIVPPRSAEAKIVIVNIGSEIFEAGPLPVELAAHPQLNGWKAGYKCGIFGVFWAYFHSWSCEPVIYRDDTYDDSPEVVSAVSAAYSEDDRDMGLWGKHGRWIFAGLFLGGLFVRGDDD